MSRTKARAWRDTVRGRAAVGAAAAVTAVAAIEVGTAVEGGAPASALPARELVPGSSPRWLHQARDLGPATPSSRVSFGILLGMRDVAGAEARVRALSDPVSPSYGRWLSPDEFKARFGPAPASAAAVRTWLRSQGFRLTRTPSSAMYVQASGSVAQVQSSFGTSLRTYAFRGKRVRANATPLSLPPSTPAAVADAVSGVIGIDQGSTLKHPAARLPGPPSGARYGAQPCSGYHAQKVATRLPSAYGRHQPYSVCGYTPQQLQSAYGVAPLLRRGIDGRGITVAVTGAYASPTLAGDVRQYNAVHRLPAFRPGQFRQLRPKSGYRVIDDCDPGEWYREQTLDIEAVHALAPGAKVVYVAGSDCTSGLDHAWAAAIDNHVADVITSSWTDGVDDIGQLGKAHVAFFRQYSLKAALTGITVNFPTGDAGDHTAGGAKASARTVEFPADLPYVTAVGGTTLLIGSGGRRLGEYGWQTAYSKLSGTTWTPVPPGTYSSGGGGGPSRLFAQPFYQRGRVPAALARNRGGTPMRVVPDIALVGDPNTGMLVGQTQRFPDGTYWSESRIGGTSLSAPLLAGLIAVAGQLGGHPLGFVNPLYYRLMSTRALHDIVPPRSPVAHVRTDFANHVNGSKGRLYRLATIDVRSSTLRSRRGYDEETGVGTPNGQSFLAALVRLRRR